MKVSSYPPPLTDVNIISSFLTKATLPALLHSAYTRVGRASLYLTVRGLAAALCLAVLPLLAGCEKDVVRYEEIKAYHAESKHLPEATADSVNRFTQKVDAFVTVYPDAAEDPLYPEIRQNIEDALVKFVITVQDEWDKEDVSY